MKEEDSQEFLGEQGYFDKNLFIRYMILTLLGVALFLFLHFREVYVETLDLNSIAPGYVVSQVDFNFLDEEATVILKQEAVRDVGKIYQLSEKEVRQKRIEFDNFLLYNQGWREQAETGTFNELYYGAEVMENALLRLRLTDPHTLTRLEEAGISTIDYQPLSISFFNKQKMSLPSSIWEALIVENFPDKDYTPFTKEIVREFFTNSSWDVEEDIPAQRELRKRIQSQIPGKYTHFEAGKRLIDQGERVTTRHVAMMQAMKRELSERRNLFQPLTLLGTFIKTILFMTIGLIYLKANYPRVISSNRKLFLLVTIIVMTLLLAKFTEFILLNSQSHLIETFRYPLLVPLAAILISSLINPGVAAFISGFLVIILSLSLAFEPIGFLLINLIASFVAIITIHYLRRRKEIFVVCFKAWIAAVTIIVALHLYGNKFFDFSLVTDILSSAFFLLATSIIVVGLLPLLESGFKILTDASLMEYMDPNSDLLRRLTMEAPGTYQHSVVVGNLAETAALAIGAKGLFCRVASLYHDVGKIPTAKYFTENQMGDVDIHQLLTPYESAEVIMAHVPEGVSMGRAAGLPEPIIDVIKQHHGTSLVYYFYRKELERQGGDTAKVDEKKFRYVGPKPHSKEAGIIMITDSFEAASRSLDHIDEETLMVLINRIVLDKIEDGQFDECSLTFEELSIIKKVLVMTLLAAGHSRVKYPAREGRENSSFLEASA